jgi:hypothetical protein
MPATAPARVIDDLAQLEAARVRMRARLDAAERGPAGSRVGVTQTFEREGSGKPVCVAQFLLHLGCRPREDLT